MKLKVQLPDGTEEKLDMSLKLLTGVIGLLALTLLMVVLNGRH